MSMSQEEIEALMNGLDIDDGSGTDDIEAEGEQTLDTKEIEELIAKSQEESFDIEDKPILQNTDEIESLLKDIDGVTNSNENSFDSLDNSDFSEIVDSTDSLKDEDISKLDEFFPEPKVSEEFTQTIQQPVQVEKTRSEDEIVNDWASSKINEGIIPTPAHNDAKVVSQLTQVANDSEEKVSQIFDVLSLALDNNTELRKSFKDCASTL